MRADLVLPSHDDAVPAALSAVVGGPVGRHARLGAARFWTPLRVVLALAMLVFTVGWLAKAPCRTHPWTDHYQYTRLCYTDVYALYFSEGLAEGKVPYADHPVEYPVVIGATMWVAAELAADAVDFYDLTSLLLLVGALVVVAATLGAAGRRRPWDAAMVALAPGLALHVTTNWDLIAVAFASLAVLAWARRRPAMAGIWLGLGVATKLYPLLFLGPLLLLCLRARRMREFATTAGTAALVWTAVNVPIARAYPASWREFYTLNRTRGADWDSLYYIGQQIARRRFDVFFEWDVSQLNLLVAGVFAIVCVGIALLTLTAPRRPRLAQLLFLTVAAFLLVNKVNSPQYTLWLIPLAVLARPRWGTFLTWQVLEFAVVYTRYYYFVRLGAPQRGLPDTWFFSAVLLRDAALLALMMLVVHEIQHPEHDRVRRAGVDDPAGGVLDGAPDRFRQPVPVGPAEPAVVSAG